MAEDSTPVYPHGTGPQSIADQITDQNTPYCDELRYAVSNDNRMLAVIQRSSKELIPVGCAINIRLKQSYDR